MTKLKTYESKYDKVSEVADMLGIKLAPLRAILDAYPYSFFGMDFREEKNGAPHARNKYSEKTINQLIVAFRSHDWKITSDIYGHTGLSNGGFCKKCNQRICLPEGEWTDDFILAYHYVYGRHKNFGRITKCKVK